MVHYSPEIFAAQTPPPICPKCGSHRTEIVGRSDDGTTVTVRCNSCGERSTVKLERPDRLGGPGGNDDASQEVEAIRTIARTLSELRDPASRMRVLRWATERFDAQGEAFASISAVPSRPVRTDDPALAVGDLREFFPSTKTTESAGDLMLVDEDVVPAPEPSADKPSSEEPQFESLVHNFVVDFQRLARDWQTVFTGPNAQASA